MLYFLNRICVFILFFFGFVFISRMLRVPTESAPVIIQNSGTDVLGLAIGKKIAETGDSISSRVIVTSDQPDTKILTSMQKLAYDTYIPDIGVYTETVQGKSVITQIVKDSPAARAHLEVSDVITAIEGKPTSGMSVSDIEHMIAGPEGDPVTLTVVHEDSIEPVTIPVVRKMTAEPTATEMLEYKADVVKDSVSKKLGVDNILEKTKEIRGGVATVMYYIEKVVDVFFAIIHALAKVFAYMM